MALIDISNKIKILNLNTNGYETRLDREMRTEIKEAARDWLRTVLAIIPVWSRGSHATFKPLADAVGFVIPTQPLVARIDRSPLGEGVSAGGLIFEKNAWSFFYETDLRYLAFNEFNAGTVGENNIFAGLLQPGPYNFTKIAGEEFENRAIRFPDPFDFLKGIPL